MRMVAALAVVLVAIAGCGDSNDAGGGDAVTIDYTVEVQREFTAEVNADPLGSCSDKGGYNDIDTGTEVEVVDGEGALLGVGRLAFDREGSGPGSCTYAATFDVQPSGDGFYRVTSGNENRGYLTRSEADIEEGTLVVAASIGD